jgi:hypothetical protein
MIKEKNQQFQHIELVQNQYKKTGNFQLIKTPKKNWIKEQS